MVNGYRGQRWEAFQRPESLENEAAGPGEESLRSPPLWQQIKDHV